MTPPSHDQLKPVSSDNGFPEERTAGFRLLHRPTPQLAQSNTELAFVVERPRSAYRIDIWTRAGSRAGEDAVSLETWQSVFEPHSQPATVPAWLEELVRSAWASGQGTDAEICIALEKGVWRLHETQRPAEAGEAVSR